MGNKDFISGLAEMTGISKEQMGKTIKSADTDKIAEDLGKKVGLDKATSKQVADTAKNLIGDNIDNIKIPFGKK